MDDAHGRGAYVEPTVTDFGDLVELTAFDQVLYGRTADGRAGDLSFSGSVGGGGSTGSTGTTTGAGTGNGTVLTAGTPSAGVSPDVTGATVTTPAGSSPGSAGTGGGGAGSGGSGGAAGGGSSLPFTGYSLGAVAAVGSALVGAGAGLRRRLRRSPSN
jgi:hypothetical protein